MQIASFVSKPTICCIVIAGLLTLLIFFIIYHTESVGCDNVTSEVRTLRRIGDMLYSDRWSSNTSLHILHTCLLLEVGATDDSNTHTERQQTKGTTGRELEGKSQENIGEDTHAYCCQWNFMTNSLFHLFIVLIG